MLAGRAGPDGKGRAKADNRAGRMFGPTGPARPVGGIGVGLCPGWRPLHRNTRCGRGGRLGVIGLLGRRSGLGRLAIGGRAARSNRV